MPTPPSWAFRRSPKRCHVRSLCIRRPRRMAAVAGQPSPRPAPPASKGMRIAGSSASPKRGIHTISAPSKTPDAGHSNIRGRLRLTKPAWCNPDGTLGTSRPNMCIRRLRIAHRLPANRSQPEDESTGVSHGHCGGPVSPAGRVSVHGVGKNGQQFVNPATVDTSGTIWLCATMSDHLSRYWQQRLHAKISNQYCAQAVPAHHLPLRPKVPKRQS